MTKPTDDGVEVTEKCQHGWRGAPADGCITDRCPTCDMRAVFVGSGGYLTCSNLRCKEPGVGRAIEELKLEIVRLKDAARQQPGPLDVGAFYRAMNSLGPLYGNIDVEFLRSLVLAFARLAVANGATLDEVVESAKGGE